MAKTDPSGQILPQARYEQLDYEYSALMGALHVSVSKHLLDDGFTVIWANDYYYSRTGYSKEEYETLFHNHVSEYYQCALEDYKKISDAVLSAMEAHEPGYECVCQMPQKGGSSIWIRAVGRFTDETLNGVPIIYSVFTDITDLVQTQMEQTLTYDNLPGFVAKFRLVENRFEFVYANNRFLDFFGERAETDPPYSLTNLDTERNREMLLANLPRMRKGEHVHFVLQVRDRNQNDAWVQINGDCVERVNGCPVYLIVYIDITDITEQRELQKRLEERTEMLRGALEMAERANQAKSDFLSRMSHDIRTPMNAIMGMIAIAEESQGDLSRIMDCLGKVKASAGFLLSLINDILDMSKIESGKMVLKKKRFDFAAFLRNIAGMFYSQAEELGVDFQVSAASGLNDAYVGDELKLNQILINLLGNAMKFTGKDGRGGKVELIIRIGKQTEKSTELLFTVRDNGIGMDEAFLEKIFVPFEQDGHQRENRGGSGLGLAIAWNYARMMNGAIEVQSKRDEGSSFLVRVWLDRAKDPAEPVELCQRFHGKHALVVESNAEEGQYTVALLKRFGVGGSWAGSMPEALKELSAKAEEGVPYNLIIIDWRIPDGGGAALARAVREQFGENAPPMAVSAYDWGSVKGLALEAGISDFLQKPLFLSTIYDFLMAATQEKPVAIASVPAIRFAGERILLVEDNDINLEIAIALMESRDLRVETARNGQEAIERFSSREPGYYYAVLMDIQMPVMNGLEATRQIRRLPREDALSVPIIAMSANAFEDDVEKSLGAGMNAHISKPVDIKILFETLRGLKK